jgi:hypothetical protein
LSAHEKYNISINKVRYKRKKYGITYFDKFYTSFINDNKEFLAIHNDESKERLCRDDNINWITKSIVHHIFRNGPVEDMHANGQLSQEDMKILNMYMVDHLGMIVSAAIHGNWLMLEEWLAYYKAWGSDWDNPKLTNEDMQKFILKMHLRRRKS